MFSLKRIPRSLFWLVLVVMSAAAVAISAQGDPDPNSPVPVLLSVEGAPRALAHRTLRSKRYSLTRPAVEAFRPDMLAVLYVANLDLMDGEGANAFRVYARDAKGIGTFAVHQVEVGNVQNREHIRAKCFYRGPSQ